MEYAIEGDSSGSEFPAFPYEPYPIQIDFMKSLYQSLHKGGISMLESPTGTGKTLSVICSALQWVIDKRKEEESARERGKSDSVGRNDGQLGSDDEPDWMRNFVVNKDNKGPEKKIKFRKENMLGNLLEKPDKRNHKEISRGEKLVDVKLMHRGKRSNNVQLKSDTLDLSDNEFLLDEYESEDAETTGNGKSKRKVTHSSFSSSSEDEDSDEVKEEEEKKFRVYFCSRTHSQLSQFVKELRKTVFANEMEVVCLGSRKNLCINEEVLKLRQSSRINERCLEFQKNKKKEVSKLKSLEAGGRLRRTKASSGCPMLRKHKPQRQFRIKASENGVLDIEDLVNLGHSLQTCPYYGSRGMVLSADLIVLPYQSLLSKSSREALGLNLKSSIIIIDEAHNLADSLISMYDSKITLSQLENVHLHVERYFERFYNRLGAGNRRYVQTLMVLTRAFLQVLLDEKDVDFINRCRDSERTDGKDKASNITMTINDFLFSLNVDNINLFKLLQYIKESNIMHKVSGYGEKLAGSVGGLAFKNIEEGCEQENIQSSFHALADLLLSLTHNDSDGRIIISRSETMCCKKEVYIKHVMLSGEKIFSEIVDQAHAVLLVGGTLQPIEETQERLFPWLSLNQLHFFSCGHIIPAESILPIAVSRGPSGCTFDFSYKSRSSTDMMKELGLLLCNLVSLVPEGIVVFFSSFDYEAQVYETWKASGIIERITKKKRVFREPRNNMDVEYVLKEYKETISSLSTCNSKENQVCQNGAILLAVVGGKISEGINLSDGMGRCIIMVGLPYPSPSDIELLERVKYIEGLGNTNPTKSSCVSPSHNISGGDVQSGFEILRCCTRRGKEYYENLCMKAVNQSIGRAIRHINDYAAILLVDNRYASNSLKRSSSRPTDKLPQWIKNGLLSSTNYGEVHRSLHQFFKINKRNCQ